MDLNPYESPQHATEIPKGRNPIAPNIAIFASAIVATAFLFTVAGAAVLNDFFWELSPANWQFDLFVGAFVGIPGAGIAMQTYCSVATNKLLAAVGCIAGWSIVASVCFYYFIIMFMIG